MKKWNFMNKLKRKGVYARQNQRRKDQTLKVIIQKPVVFPYKDNKRVPWNYNCNVTVPGKEGSTSTEDQNIRSHTRSGKRYDLVNA
ncbi:aldehyde dehydrogenase family 2 member C4-like [Gossypium australe]|uniref:Aldehyde dehydrogenase family 2 member C4-like n=1 Tax=Gossypium australe TaxID=47621 RepID=A0A5B6X289_9ROSI|nr:aldehyde dehydrogenase family 2 member C4-like [Gossypium australe]